MLAKTLNPLRWLVAAASIAAAGAASAGTAITVPVDHAKVLSVAGSPTSVIVGNPLFADVSVQGGKVVLHGRTSGSTNVLLFDTDGNQLGNFDVTVVRGGDNTITVYKGGAQLSTVCAPNCEYTLQAGDAPEWVKSLNETISAKTNQSQAAAGVGASN